MTFSFFSPQVLSVLVCTRPVSRRISHRPLAEKFFGLAAIDFDKPPAAGRKKIRLSRRFCRRLSRDHNDLHSVKVVIIQQCIYRKLQLELLRAVLHPGLGTCYDRYQSRCKKVLGQHNINSYNIIQWDIICIGNTSKSIK